MLRTLIALVTTLAFASPLWAFDTLDVPGDYDTIQAAVDDAADGDTIVIKSGTYDEHVTIDGFTGLCLLGKGKVVIDAGPAAGDGPAVLVSDSSDIEVVGLTIRGGTGKDGSGIRVVDTNGVTISKCTTDSNADDGVSIESCTDVLVEKCESKGDGDEGICVFDSTNITIEKNKITGNGEKGIHLQRNDDTSMEALVSKNTLTKSTEAAIVIEGSGVCVEKNKISNGADDGICVRNPDGFTATDVVVEKNKIQKVDGDGIVLGGSGNRAEKNTVKDAGEDGLRFEEDGGHLGLKNKISKVGGDGVEISEEAEDNRLDGNKFTMTGRDGVNVNSAGNEIDGNKVSKASGDGFEIDGGNNTLDKNQASKSGEFGLSDHSDGSNTYTGNKFDSIDPGGNQP